MATDWQTFPLEFKGGLISNLTPLQQGTNAIGSATILENFEPSLTGGYSKIKVLKDLILLLLQVQVKYKVWL